jgi:hypothetical protein
MKRFTQNIGPFLLALLALLLSPLRNWYERNWCLAINPMTAEQFGDLLDPRFQKIFFDYLKEPNDMIPMMYTDAGTNGRENIRWSSVGQISEWEEFTGNVPYSSMSQGYDVILTPIEFAKGIQVGRRLFDDDQYNIMDQKPKGLASAARRLRQRHAARILTNAFSVDSYFYNHTEGVALCSDNHTTTSGASTASGFDNKGTSALTAVAVATNRINMVRFRGDQAERLDYKPDEIWIPPELYEVAFEIVSSMGKVDTANNNRNVHNGAYDIYEWTQLDSAKNWFMCNKQARKEMVFWSDRVPIEFAMIEDFDTLIAKWRGYGRWGNAYTDWRWIIGNQVS